MANVALSIRVTLNTKPASQVLITILGRSNENWHVFTISILEVRNSFMKNLLITKSSDFTPKYRRMRCLHAAGKT